MAHITVTPANEDEVIFAGISSEPQVGAVSAAAELAGTAGAESAAGFVPGSAVIRNDATNASKEVISAPNSVGVSDMVAPSADSAANAQSEAAAVVGGAPKDSNRNASSSKNNVSDAYHETTLEDLESTPMPLAQRIVIVAAVVCIIGALVYYFVAMR